jgi:hypothetical protein
MILSLSSTLCTYSEFFSHGLRAGCRYLKADMQHACWDAAHMPVAIVASILWLFYAVGFPAVKDKGGEVIIMLPCLFCM